MKSSKDAPKIYGAIFDVESKRQRLQEIEALSEKPEIWNSPKEMQKLQKEKSVLSKSITEFDRLISIVDDASVLLELALEGNDEDSFNEVKSSLVQGEQLFSSLELKKMLGGEADLNGA